MYVIFLQTKIKLVSKTSWFRKSNSSSKYHWKLFKEKQVLIKMFTIHNLVYLLRQLLVTRIGYAPSYKSVEFSVDWRLLEDRGKNYEECWSGTGAGSHAWRFNWQLVHVGANIKYRCFFWSLLCCVNTNNPPK